jgi:hypothetical protein
MAQTKRRAKSNTLFRLVKSLSPGLFARLKVFNDTYAKGSKQWKLIEYYYYLTEWSREKELADWPDGRISALKYNALQWLFDALSKVGDWPGKEIFHAFGDVATALNRKVYQCADEFWAEAKPHIVQQERFGLLLEFLGLEREIIRVSYSHLEIPFRLAENFAFTKKIIALHSEIIEIEEFRSIYFDPIKIQHSINGSIPRDLLALLKAEIQKFNLSRFETVRGKFAYLRMKVFLDLLDGLSNAADPLSKLIELHLLHKWLREEDLGRFFIDVRSAIFSYSARNDHKRIAELLALFDMYDFDDPWIFTLQLVPRIESNFNIAVLQNNLEAGAYATTLLSLNQERVLRESTSSTITRIYHYAAISEMNAGNNRASIQWLEKLLTLKSHQHIDRVASAKVILLMNHLITAEDPFFLDNLASATAKYLQRKEKEYPHLLAITLTIGRLARRWGESEYFTHEIKKLLKYLEDVVNTPLVASQFEHIDYRKWLRDYLELIKAHQ